MMCFGAPCFSIACDLPDERDDLGRCPVRGGTGGFFIFDLVQPSAEGGSGDAEIAGDLPPGDLEGFRIPEDQKSLTDLISRFLALLGVLFLKDRDLHFELIDPVFEKEDLLGFGIDIHGSQSLQASPADPS